ncbi:MAG: ABC transporter ATP-binding protein [Candidatus Omnitrophica bacterium]|nr:ABC transporter ATP-binding protein [Candidatus Omnitrophota bacterium]
MLEVFGIHKHYDHPSGKVQVLKGIDLKVNSGDVVAIVGPSGAGKSTLLHIMGGLDRPAEGQVRFDDEDLYRLNENKRAQVRNQKFGFIFQFYHLLPEFTALENVILPALVEKNADLDAVKAKAVKLLDKVGLSQRYEHKPHELSGGEQQRVAIARALINEPKVIFCDEPTGNLDSESGKGVIDLLMELNQKNKQTLVIVTHDESIAKRSHRVVPMRDGKLQ